VEAAMRDFLDTYASALWTASNDFLDEIAIKSSSMFKNISIRD
jgi:hypothetical protein